MGADASSNTSDVWRRALGVATSVKLASAELVLEPRYEWLRQVMDEAAEQMRSAVLWAAQQHPASHITRRENLRPLVVAADATRSNAALASYFVSFLAHERLLAQREADEIHGLLTAIEAEMDALSRRMREDLGFDPYAPSAR